MDFETMRLQPFLSGSYNNSCLPSQNRSQLFNLLDKYKYNTGNHLLSYRSEYLAVLLSALIVVRLCQKKLKKGRSWIDSLPGPRTFPVVGGLLYFSPDLKRTFQILRNWSEKYGPIFRSEGLFNDPYIFLNNVNHVQALLSSNHLGFVSKPRIPYDSMFGQFLKNGLLVSQGEYWKAHRRIVSRAFTYNAFQRYTKTFNQHSKILVKDLEQLFPENCNQPKQISELIHCCSLQIICESVMGLDLRDSMAGEEFNENFQRYKVISSEKASNFWFMIDLFWKLHPTSREYQKIIDKLNHITGKIIENHIENNEKHAERKSSSSSVSDSGETCDIGARVRRSMIDEMWASGLTAEEILVEANTVIAAGFESTSLTIHYLLFLLALNPEHQRACQEEIDELFEDPVKCQNGNLTVDALSEMKCLERCTLETLRLFPVIFLFQRKPEVPVKLDEHLELPAGINVIIPTYCIHRNPKYFPTPDNFEPDRFLPENVQKRHPYAFIPFSSGIRNCIGYKFAMLEIKAVAAHILRHFSITTVDKINDVPILPSIVMTPVRDYKFILNRRLRST